MFDWPYFSLRLHVTTVNGWFRITFFSVAFPDPRGGLRILFLYSVIYFAIWSTFFLFTFGLRIPIDWTFDSSILHSIASRSCWEISIPHLFFCWCSYLLLENKCTNIFWRFCLVAVLLFGLIRSTNLMTESLDAFWKRAFVIVRFGCGNFYANYDFQVTKFIQAIVYLFHFLSWGSCIC